MMSFRLTVSRTRKQRFPRVDRRKAPVGETINRDDDLIVDEQPFLYSHAKRPNLASRIDKSPPRPPATRPPQRSKRESEDRGTSSIYSAPPRLDKRARDEHNEQERSRRRELAVIYELIRSSFSQDDLRHLEAGSAPKSIDKLSYPQVLQIAHSIMVEETHNIRMFERTILDIRYLEKELVKAGVNVPARPPCPSLTENYRKVVSAVENILRTDKLARNSAGMYEMSPSDRAIYGDQQLSFVRNRHSHILSDTYELLPPSEKRIGLINRRHSTVSRYSALNNQSYHSSSTRPSLNSSVSNSLTPRSSVNNSSFQLNSQSRLSASNGSVASLEDLEDLDLHSIGDTYDLFANPLEELEHVDATFSLLPDL